MPEITINDVSIKFPFTPYQVQNDYMRKVLECLQLGQNGVLESPTGTGKTLCLLCATLGWLEIKKAESKANFNAMGADNSEELMSIAKQLSDGIGSAWQRKNDCPKIIYASRTHSQLSQAVSELKRTAYSYMKVSVLGSRDQMCIHPQVSKEVNNSTKVTMCQVRVKGKNCYFHNQIEKNKEDPELKNTIMDLEDLVKYGRKKTFCPYYMSREMRQDADIIFLPYNYLLDPKTRKAHGIDLQGNVIIFDEAHNVEKMCEESASLQLRSTDLALCIDEVTQALAKVYEATNSEFGSIESAALPNDFSTEELSILKTMLITLEKEMTKAEPGKTHGGSFMFEFLEKAEIYQSRKVPLLELLDKLVLYLTTNSNSPLQKKGVGLQKFAELIQIVFSKDSYSVQQKEFIQKCYKVHISEEKPKANKQDGWGAQKQINTAKVPKVFSYWCFNPGFGMKDLVDQDVKCLLLTSGTLSPIDCFTTELQVPFPVQLENPHIIDSSQVFVGTISCGPDNTELNSCFKNRDNPKYLTALGQTIANFSRMIPGGLLVFFPSYPIMKACHEFWMNSGLWNTLVNIQPVFMEPQTKQNFTNIMDEFYQKIRDPTLKGACFMAVCRGKVSEGLDFADRNGRGVIVTGLPYPPFKDQRVVLKRQYLEQTRAENKAGLTGDHWYRLEASRAVNQAIGRVIRHKDDYGVILLCDRRFGDAQFKGELSAWVRPHMKVYGNKGFGTALRHVRDFFLSVKQKFPETSREVVPNNHIKIEYEDYSMENTSKSFQPTSSRRLIQRPIPITDKKPSLEDLYKQEAYRKVTAPAFFAKRKASSPVKVDLFTSLDKSASVINFDTSLPGPNFDSRQSEAVTLPKKKIKIISAADKNLRDFINAAKPDTTSQPATSSKDAKTIGIAQYLKEVKSALSKEDYASFSKAVKEYYATKNLQQVFEKFFPLFCEEGLRHKYLKNFSAFLKNEHKAAFDKKYEELFGS